MTIPLTDLPISLANGKSLRLRAFSAADGRTSPSWKLWSRGRDIYLCQRSLGSDVKLSLHESGSFQTSFVNEIQAEKWLGPNRSRHLDRWRQPAEFAPGWTLLVSVVHPERELGRFIEYGLDRKPYVDMPIGEGYALHVSVFLSRPTAVETKMNFTDSIHMATADLAGHEVHIMGILHPWGDNEMAIAEVARQRPRGANPRSLVPPNGDFDPDSPSARLLTSTLQPGGHRCFVDLAAVPPSE